MSGVPEHRWRISRRAGGAAVALLAIAVLIWLGVWQLQRRAWKGDFIARIEATAAAPAQSLGDILTSARAGGDIAFARIALTGRFEHTAEMRLNTVLDGTPGWALITPLLVAGGEVVLVERGFIPAPLEAPETRAGSQPEGDVPLIARIRPAEIASPFAPAPDLARRRWYGRDIAAMTAALPAALAARTAPFIAVAELPAAIAGPAATSGALAPWPRPTGLAVQVPNRHLEYALTWFALAATLAFMAPFILRRR